MHNMMAVRLWVTCYSLIMIFLNKTFFVRKDLKTNVLEIFQNKHYIFVLDTRQTFMCFQMNEVIFNSQLVKYEVQMKFRFRVLCPLLTNNAKLTRSYLKFYTN